MGVASGLTILVFLIRIFRNIGYNRSIEFLSTISFEIYLVHHPFSFGQFDLSRYIHSAILCFICLIIESILFASVLHKVSELLKNIFSFMYKKINYNTINI